MVTNEEYRYLMLLQKRFKDTKKDINLAGSLDRNTKWEKIIIDESEKHKFTLHFNRSSISLKLAKYSYNFNHRNNITLLRFDAEGIHTNPPDAGGKTFFGPHVHIYSEEFGDRVAYPIDAINLPLDTDCSEMQLVFTKILQYCNISIPIIRNSLDL